MGPGRTQEQALASQDLTAAAGSTRALGTTTTQAATLGHTAALTSAIYAYRATMTSRRGIGSIDAVNAVASTTSFPYATTQPIGSTATSSLAKFTNNAATLGRAKGISTDVATAAEASATAASMANRLGEELLDGKSAQLAVGPVGGLPATLTPVEATFPAATKLRRWQFGAEYAATTFNPNIDFATSTSYPNYPSASNSYAPSFSVGNKSAAAEYRSNLRAGLGQRLSLRATRWLGGHWSLSTGVEAAEQKASSATSMGFDGVHMDMSNAYATAARPLQTSSYRYRSAGVPVELRYDNPIKNGVSFYGRLGAIVSALLNVRTELAGNPETARNYSPFSGSTPYRRLTTLLRGGAGVRYRPAHKGWGVHVGPTAEAGMQSLNADTDKNFLQQSRPYSFGLEAGFEFGGGVVPVQ
jgi:hypothetical protein